MKFLKQILHRGCTHRFAWPRSDENGRHYQICLACGAAYEYDWNTMRQTGRLLTPPQTDHPTVFAHPYLR